MPSFGSTYYRKGPNGPDRQPTGKLRLQKLIGENWVTTGAADSLEAAANHAGAVGGVVRAVDRKGVVVGEWEEA